MLLRPVAVLANMLNPRCRGILLKEEERASALKVLGSFSEELGIPAPSVDEVLEFIQCRGAFVGVCDLQCTRFCAHAFPLFPFPVRKFVCFVLLVFGGAETKRKIS